MDNMIELLRGVLREEFPNVEQRFAGMGITCKKCLRYKESSHERMKDYHTTLEQRKGHRRRRVVLSVTLGKDRFILCQVHTNGSGERAHIPSLTGRHAVEPAYVGIFSRDAPPRCSLPWCKEGKRDSQLMEAACGAWCMVHGN